MKNIDIFRMFLGLVVGPILGIVSLINVWMTWMNNGDTSFHWTLAVVGGLLWLQGVPVVQASDRRDRKKQILEMLNKEKQ